MNVETTESIAHWRAQIDDLDREIIARLTDRLSLSRRIQGTRIRGGGSRLATDREREIVERYGTVLGDHGTRLAALILDMSRGVAGGSR